MWLFFGQIMNFCHVCSFTTKAWSWTWAWAQSQMPNWESSFALPGCPVPCEPSSIACASMVPKPTRDHPAWHCHPSGCCWPSHPPLHGFATAQDPASSPCFVVGVELCFTQLYRFPHKISLLSSCRKQPFYQGTCSSQFSFCAQNFTEERGLFVQRRKWIA